MSVVIETLRKHREQTAAEDRASYFDLIRRAAADGRLDESEALELQGVCDEGAIGKTLNDAEQDIAIINEVRNLREQAKGAAEKTKKHMEAAAAARAYAEETKRVIDERQRGQMEVDAAANAAMWEKDAAANAGHRARQLAIANRELLGQDLPEDRHPVYLVPGRPGDIAARVQARVSALREITFRSNGEKREQAEAERERVAVAGEAERAHAQKLEHEAAGATCLYISEEYLAGIVEGNPRVNEDELRFERLPSQSQEEYDRLLTAYRRAVQRCDNRRANG